MEFKRLMLFTIVLIVVFLSFKSYFQTAQIVATKKNYLRDLKDQNLNIKENIDWKKIPRKPSPRPEDMHDKWIVITTVSSPTEDVKKLSKIEGWKVVVVGDTKTPEDWSYPNCIFLSVENQRTLGYRIHDLIPYKSYARKNIGYLYAIQHGAKIIYETDDDNSPTSGNIAFYQKGIGDFYVYETDSVVVNPYEHFGQSSIWPRGYPLDYIADPPTHKFVRCEGVDISIQQGLVNGDPDVDAIFRLTRKDKGVDLNVKFDGNALPVALPPTTLAPFNSQNTLFLNRALWGMLLPTTVTFRVTDIWRGYWAQRLLWDVGSHLSFFPPNAVQFRNVHNYLADFIDEQNMYQQSSRLVNFLISWQSDKQHFFSRVLELSLAMTENGFWEMHDAVLTKAWLEDLVSIGYETPVINPVSKPCNNVKNEGKEILPREKASSYLRAGKELEKLRFMAT
ncbi:uncharacterized protein [Montipora capricornis]|uniref:uncharacterized protein isoform X1 n=1 Tax=Montipora capricornis TaxID=246305 RepID=UPI0035F1BB6E